MRLSRRNGADASRARANTVIAYDVCARSRRNPELTRGEPTLFSKCENGYESELVAIALPQRTNVELSAPSSSGCGRILRVCPEVLRAKQCAPRRRSSRWESQGASRSLHGSSSSHSRLGLGAEAPTPSERWRLERARSGPTGAGDDAKIVLKAGTSIRVSSIIP